MSSHKSTARGKVFVLERVVQPALVAVEGAGVVWVPSLLGAVVSVARRLAPVFLAVAPVVPVLLVVALVIPVFRVLVPVFLVLAPVFLAVAPVVMEVLAVPFPAKWVLFRNQRPWRF